MRIRVSMLLVMALLVVATAFAQQMPQMQPVVYVADFNIKPGKFDDFMNLVKKYDEPTFDKLMSEGAVLAWGLDEAVLHEPGAPTHSFWWTSPDMGAFDKVFAAFEAEEKKMKEDDMAAAAEARKKGRPAPKSVNDIFMESVDWSKHKDWIFRDLAVRFGGGPPPAGARPYSWITVVRVEPGKSDEFRQLWDKYIKPVLDKLVDDNTIHGYEMGVEEVKTTDSFTHFVIITLPNLAAREKVRNAFYADRQARTPEEREVINHRFTKVLDYSATRNMVLHSVILHVAAPKM